MWASQTSAALCGEPGDLRCELLQLRLERFHFSCGCVVRGSMVKAAIKTTESTRHAQPQWQKETNRYGKKKQKNAKNGKKNHLRDAPASASRSWRSSSLFCFRRSKGVTHFIHFSVRVDGAKTCEAGANKQQTKGNPLERTGEDLSKSSHILPKARAFQPESVHAWKPSPFPTALGRWRRIGRPKLLTQAPYTPRCRRDSISDESR